MLRAWALTLVIIAVASGCQPVVETREFRYSALVSIDGREQTLSGSYTCYFDNPFLDMGGPYWYIVRHKPLAGRGGMDLALRGAAANGIVFEIHPTLEAVLALNATAMHQGLCAIAKDNDLASVVYYRRPGETAYHSSTASQAADATADAIVLKSAERELVSQGHALHGEHKDDGTAAAMYYSVALYILPAKTIDEIGMREYLAKHPLIWLKAGATLPLDRERAREIVGYGFPFNEQVRIYRQRQDWRSTPAMVFSSDSRWELGRVRDWVRLDPGQAQGITGGSHLLDWTPPPPTTWVEYKGCRVEIPLLQFERRHVYDPEADQLVIFEPEIATLSAD